MSTHAFSENDSSAYSNLNSLPLPCQGLLTRHVSHNSSLKLSFSHAQAHTHTHTDSLSSSTHSQADSNIHTSTLLPPTQYSYSSILTHSLSLSRFSLTLFCTDAHMHTITHTLSFFLARTHYLAFTHSNSRTNTLC